MKFLEYCRLNNCEIRNRYYAENDEYVVTVRYKDNACVSIRISSDDVAEMGNAETIEYYILTKIDAIREQAS